MKVNNPIELVEFFGDIETAATALDTNIELIQSWLDRMPDQFVGPWQGIVDLAVERHLKAPATGDAAFNVEADDKRVESFYLTAEQAQTLAMLGDGSRSKGLYELIEIVSASGTLEELL